MRTTNQAGAHTQYLRALLLFVLTMFYACRSRDLKEIIEGTWKIDSVYTFYNGFGSMETTIVDLEQYTYLVDGRVEVTWSGTTHSMSYALIAQDTLKYFENEAEVSRYLILELNNDRLVLRKDKQPLFGGRGQERYEIRYFSRVLSSPPEVAR